MDQCVNYPEGSANGQKFSTKDQDNDRRTSGHCAALLKGGWWYNKCDCSNFNNDYSLGMDWDGWSYSIKKSIMMIRRTQ